MEKNKREVIKFYGKDHPLSNFYEAPFRVGSFIWPTVEHFYAAHKSSDFYERLEILMADTPSKAKQMGREVELRSDWDKKRLIFMWKGLKAKFLQNPDLKKYLLDTGDAELIKNSTWDVFWGIGKNNNGKNMLGKMLMKLRKEIRENTYKEIEG